MTYAVAPQYPGAPMERVCEWCGASYKTRRGTQKFCSVSHRVLAYQWRKEQRERREEGRAEPRQ